MSTAICTAAPCLVMHRVMRNSAESSPVAPWIRQVRKLSGDVSKIAWTDLAKSCDGLLQILGCGLPGDLIREYNVGEEIGSSESAPQYEMDYAELAIDFHCEAGFFASLAYQSILRPLALLYHAARKPIDARRIELLGQQQHLSRRATYDHDDFARRFLLLPGHFIEEGFADIELVVFHVFLWVCGVTLPF